MKSQKGADWFMYRIDGIMIVVLDVFGGEILEDEMGIIERE